MLAQSPATLPMEIIYRIFCFLSPRDVVRLRTVSKRFRDTSYLAGIWRTLYANARLPRPPGPFPSQSVQLLERTLVKSARLAQSWTTQPMREISSVRVRLEPGLPAHRPKLVNGRWLIVCESSRKLVVHDIDSETVPRFRQVLLEHGEPMHGWDACTVTSVDGPVVYIVSSASTSKNTSPSWKLLEFRVNRISGHLYHSFSLDLPTMNFVYLRGGHGPFLHLPSQHLIFDAETRQLYKIPPFDLALGNLPLGWRHEALTRVYTLLTKTHVITLYPIVHDTFVLSTLVRAWTLPPEGRSIRSGIDPLCLSHEGIIDGYLQTISLVRNSRIDPASGATNIRLLDQSYRGSSGVRFSCIDLTLPKHTPTDTSAVSQMAIDTYDILKADNVPPGRRRSWSCHVNSSDDGHARGFWRFCPDDSEIVQWPPSNHQVMQFTIDASQERCTCVMGNLSYPRWSQIDHPLRTLNFWVDCARGRFCYTNRWFATGDDAELAIVVDVVD